jgi:hypothetical protein
MLRRRAEKSRRGKRAVRIVRQNRIRTAGGFRDSFDRTDPGGSGATESLEVPRSTRHWLRVVILAT